MKSRDRIAAGVLGNGLFYGVSCGERVPYESEESVEAAGARAFPGSPPSILRNAPNLQFMRSNCEVWNVPPVGGAIREVTESKIPTLACALAIARDFFAVLNEVDTNCATRVPATEFVITAR